MTAGYRAQYIWFWEGKEQQVPTSKQGPNRRSVRKMLQKTCFSFLFGFRGRRGRGSAMVELQVRPWPEEGMEFSYCDHMIM